jgi:hypothetical protein
MDSNAFSKSQNIPPNVKFIISIAAKELNQEALIHIEVWTCGL